MGTGTAPYSTHAAYKRPLNIEWAFCAFLHHTRGPQALDQHLKNRYGTHIIPRLCNGSTADSGSACGGSNPPWGISFLFGRLSQMLRRQRLKKPPLCKTECLRPRPLRLSVRTKDSQSLKRGSIPLGANIKNKSLFYKDLFLFTKIFVALARKL